MITPSAPITDAMLAVSAWKHRQLLEAQRCILHAAMSRRVFGPEHVNDETLEGDDRQGCLSNGYNALVAAELIERLPLTYNDPEHGIYGGRMKNGKKGAKGRWTAAYRLKSYALALAWLERNGFADFARQVKPLRQEEMFA